MDKKRFYKKGDLNIFRVNQIFNIRPEIFSIDAEYDFICSDISHVSDTGFLTIFKIVSTNTNLPSFVGRWDQNYSTLDIDLVDNGNNFSKLFKSEKSGYAGHHPKRISATAHLYKLEIAIPDKKILSGQIFFNLGHGHAPELFSKNGNATVRLSF